MLSNPIKSRKTLKYRHFASKCSECALTMSELLGIRRIRQSGDEEREREREGVRERREREIERDKES